MAGTLFSGDQSSRSVKAGKLLVKLLSWYWMADRNLVVVHHLDLYMLKDLPFSNCVLGLSLHLKKIMANSICWKLYCWVQTSLINSLPSSTLSLLAQC